MLSLIFSFFVLPLAQAKLINTELSIKTARQNIQKQFSGNFEFSMGKKTKIYDQNGLSFFATVKKFEEKMPEMPEGTPIMIYGEVYQDGKIVGRPQVLTMLGQQATFASERSNGDKVELKFLPVLIK